MGTPEPSNLAERKPALALRLALYFIPLLSGLIYWLAFFPGVMSFDSVSQWDQLSRLQINDLHPAFTTILMWLLTRLWYSPGVISLFQVIFASLVIGYGLNTLLQSTRLPGWIFIIIAVLLAANPLVGIMDVTLWKDVVYGFLVLLLTIFIFNIVKSNGSWIRKPVHFILLGLTLALIYLFRFNGVPIVIVSLICLMIIYRSYFKPLLYSVGISLAIILLVVGPLFSVFKVERSLTFSYGIPFIHPVVAYVSSNQSINTLSPAEKNYLNLIYPLDKPWPYSCYDATVFYYQGTNLIPVIEQPSTIVRIFTRLAAQNPLIALKHFACLSSFIWQPGQPKGVYLETILFDNYNVDQTPAWSIYKETTNQKPVLPQVHRLIQRLVNAEWHRDTNMLLWRPALYMYAFLISVVLLVVRTQISKWLLLAVPLLAQSIGIMFTAPLQALRYQYPVYLIAMLFCLPLIIVSIKYPQRLSVRAL